MLAGVDPSAAKQNSCDGPIVLDDDFRHRHQLVAGRPDKMTEAFEKEFNKSGGVFLSSCNKKLPIKFVYYDDQSIAATAVSLYEKMATVDNVDLFLGPDWSTHGPGFGCLREVQDPERDVERRHAEGVPERLQIHRRHCARRRTWSKNYFEMLAGMNPKPKSVFWIVQDNLVTKAVHESGIPLADKVGLKTVGTEHFAGATKNFSGAILKVKAAQPDVIYISAFDAVSVPLVQQMRQLVKAMDVHHIMANGSMARQADLEGVSGEIYWHEGLGGNYTDFARAVLQQADIKVFDYLWTIGRIDAYLVMLQAIERAGAVDREKVTAELRKPGASWKHVGGEFQFDEGGLSQIVSYTHQMQKGEPAVVARRSGRTAR